MSTTTIAPQAMVLAADRNPTRRQHVVLERAVITAIAAWQVEHD